MDLNNKKKTLEINVSKRIKFEKLENSVSKRKDLTVSEFSFLLPSAFTFDQSKMDISALTLLQKYGTFNEKETSFFIKMVQTTDQEEEQVYKLLLNLLKGDRKKKKKAVKNLCKIKNHKLIVEKIILMIIFLGKISTTEYLLKIVDFLYLKHRENFNCWVEVVFLLTIFLEDENLQNYAYKILSNILIFDTNRITLLVEQEINTEDQNIQKIVSRLLFLLIINKGYNTVIDMFITNNNTIMRVLEAHYFIFKYVDIEIVDLKNEIFIFLKKILLKNNIRFTIEIGNILSYYCLQGFMNDKDCLRWFNDIIKIFRNVFNETKYSNVKKEKFYKMSLLRTCAVLSANNQESSKTIYDFLALWDDFDKNNIKIFYRIFENLCYEDVESYILKYFSFFLIKNM